MATMTFVQDGEELTAHEWNGCTVNDLGNAVTYKGKTFANWRTLIWADNEGEGVPLTTADFDNKATVIVYNDEGAESWYWLVPWREGMNT